MANECPKCQTNNPDTLKFCGECGTPLTADVVHTKTIETPTEELTTGSTFAGRYQIIEELGKGGMGRVYKVLDKETKEKVALKLIKPEISTDKKTIERFRNELTTARKIAHRNVCKMFDLNKEKDNYYITMELISGGDLKRFIRRSGQLTVGTAIKIAKQICDGLEEAHGLGIVHRDLKPNNIMIDDNGNARIMDFGIARTIREKGITGPGVMIGTPEYMSPEQVEAKDIDQRSDIYSLGVIMYEMLTGRLPFEADTAFAVGVKHKSEIPKSPKEYNSQISDDLNRVILKCLEKDKEDRYKDAGEVKSELEKIEQGLPTTDRVIPPKKTLTSREITVTFGMKKLLIPALIIIAVIIIGAALLIILPQKKGTPLLPGEKRALAVISFENETGDEAFDRHRRFIPNLLITKLEQSGLFQVATWERMHDLLRQLDQENVEFIDRDLGFELCRMDGIDTIVLGTYSKAGEIFAIDVKVLDVSTKSLLTSTSSTGDGEGSILKSQIDELSRGIIRGLGVPETKLEEDKVRIADVTTTSTEAYDYYMKGMDAANRRFWEEQRQYFEKAVEIDPTFAMAYLGLSGAHQSLGNTKESVEALEKAMTYSQKLSDKERLYLEFRYAYGVENDYEKVFKIVQDAVRRYPKEKDFHYVLGWYYQSQVQDQEKAIEKYNKVLELDPYDEWALNQIGYAYYVLMDYSKAIDSFKRAISSNPDFPNPLDSLADTYFRIGRLDEALASLKEALRIKPDFQYSSHNIIYIFAAKEDYSEALKWTDRHINIAPSSAIKGIGYMWKGFYEFWLGHFENSVLELDKAIDLAEKEENEMRKAFVQWLKAWMYEDTGELDLSRKYFENSFPIIISANPQYEKFYESYYNFQLGMLDVRSKDIDSATKKLVKIKSVFPELSERQKEWSTFWIGLLQAEILLAEGNIEQVIASFENTSAVSSPSLQYTVWMLMYNYPSLKDVVARAYIQKGDIDSAIAEYDRLTAFDPETKGRYLIHPKYYYRLAQLYEQKGWAGKAIENYEKFLELWKDADPGLPEVEDAKKRLAGFKQ